MVHYETTPPSGVRDPFRETREKKKGNMAFISTQKHLYVRMTGRAPGKSTMR